MKTTHLPLIIGISLPIVFIILISIVIFAPSLFIKPQNNFIYSTNENAYAYNQGYKNTYTVENNYLSIQTLPVPQNTTYTYKGEVPPLYLYDVKNNSSHLITLDEGKKYTLDPGPSSPDGYTIKYEYGDDGIFEIFGRNHNNSGYFISKNNGRKRLTGFTDNDRYYYPGNLKLIGWIK